MIRVTKEGTMPRKQTAVAEPRAKIHVYDPSYVEAAGNKPKQITEYVGRVASGHTAASVARMVSPSGWMEPAQTPEFDEFSVVLRGELWVSSTQETTIVRAGQAVHVPSGIRVQYSTPGPDGAEYIAVCLPAFSAESVHRE
jgi:ethanolamine utilization protein EutQ (cupin superfamily)